MGTAGCGRAGALRALDGQGAQGAPFIASTGSPIPSFTALSAVEAMITASRAG